MKKYFFLLCMTMFFSCRKGPGDFFSPIVIRYVDKNGNPLFTNGQNGYYKDSVKVYDLKNGIAAFIPNGYIWVDWAPSTLRTGDANNDIVNRYYTCLIHLKTGIDDTLKVHLTGDQQMGSYNDSIWYNGKLSKMNDSCACMTIIK